MDIQTIGIIGAGTMGHGIAHVAAAAGYRVLLYDVTKELADRGRAKIAENLEKGVQKGKVKPEDRDAALARIETTSDLEVFAPCQMTIEAIPEDLALKQTLFKQLSEICDQEAILATNTSSLSLTEIAAAATRPERVVGMHFFNPVHLMKLLELVRAYQTSDATLEVARQVGERMGKQVITVNDHPGFASSRLGIALGMEAIRMVEEGVASPEDIDPPGPDRETSE